MGKLIWIAVIVIAIVMLMRWGGNALNQAGIGPTPTPAVAPGAPTAPDGGPSTKPEMEKGAKLNRVTITQFKESTGNIVELVVRGYDRNDLSNFLDSIVNAGFVYDIFHDDMKYWMAIEEGRQIHYAYYKLRAYL